MITKAGTIHLFARRLIRGSAAVFLAASMARPAVPAIAPMEEYQLKSRVLLLLPQYILWPEAPDPASRFVISVVGKSPFGTKLDDFSRATTVLKRPVEVRYVVRVSDLRPCEMVFICRSERRIAGEILDWARGKGVVTITDDEELLRRGVMIDLLIEGGTVKIWINSQAVAAERIKLDPRLRGLAKFVD